MLAELEVNGLVVTHDPAEVLEVREHLGVNEEWFVLGQESGEHTWNWWHVYVLDFEVDLFLPKEEGKSGGRIEVLLVVVLQAGHVLLCDPVDKEGCHKGEEANEGSHCHHNAEARLCSFLYKHRLHHEA